MPRHTDHHRIRARRPIRVAVLAVTAVVCLGLVAQAGLGAFGSPSGPPAPLITSAPIRNAVARSATFAFDGIPAATFECSLDDRPFLPCPSPVTYRRLELGAHEFRVRAVAPEGVRGTPAAFPWRIVRSRPHPHPTGPRSLVPRPVMTTVPVSPSSSRNATFAWQAQRGWPWLPGTTFQCSLDERPWRLCSTPTTYLDLRHGTHLFRVRAVERSGRTSSTNQLTWTISAASVPPPVEIGTHLASTTDESSALFVFDVPDGLAADCRLDDGGWEPCGSPVFLVGLAPGAHLFCIRTIGPVGERGPETCVAWTVEAPGGTGGAPSTPEPPPTGTFTIAGDLPSTLAPGIGGHLPLTIVNPFDFDLRVTDLGVTVAAGSSNEGCDGPTNLAVTQSSSLTGAVPILVPANGSVTLPAQGATAPVVTMLNLATNQDACKSATFTLAYSGVGARNP